VLGTRYHLTQGKTRDLLAQILGLDCTYSRGSQTPPASGSA